MSWTGVRSGACSLLIATSSFEADNNTGWIDPGVLDTTTCRWAAIFAPGPIEIPRTGFGKQDVVWSLILQTWIVDDADFSHWQNDHDVVIQDVVDALKGDDTLAGSCENAVISLVDVSVEERGARRYDVLSWLIEAEEYG